MDAFSVVVFIGTFVALGVLADRAFGHASIRVQLLVGSVGLVGVVFQLPSGPPVLPDQPVLFVTWAAALVLVFVPIKRALRGVWHRLNVKP